MGRRTVRPRRSSQAAQNASGLPRVLRGVVCGREVRSLRSDTLWGLEPLESRALLSAGPAPVWALPAIIDQAHPAIIFQFSAKKGNTRAALSSVVRIDGNRQTRVSIDAVHGIPDCVTIKLPPLKAGGVIKTGDLTGKPATEGEKASYTETKPRDTDSDDSKDDDKKNSGGKGGTRTKPRPGGAPGGGSSGTGGTVIVDSPESPTRPMPSPEQWLELAGELLGSTPNTPRVPPTGVAIVGTGKGGETVVIVQPAPKAPLPPPLQGPQALPRPQQVRVESPDSSGAPSNAAAAVFSRTPVAGGAVRPPQASEVVMGSSRSYVGSFVSAPVVRSSSDSLAARSIALTSDDAGWAGDRRAGVSISGWHDAADTSVEVPLMNAAGAAARALSNTLATIDPAGALAAEPGTTAGFADWPAATPLGLANLSSLGAAAASGLAAWRLTAGVSLAIAVAGFAYCRAAARANNLQTAKLKVTSSGNTESFRHASTARRRWVQCRVIR